MRTSLRTITAGALLAACAAVAAAMSPTETVREAVNGVIAVLRDKSVSGDERWQRIAPIIDRNFDFQTMSQSVLATNWRSATAGEKRQFVDFFSQYIEATYREKIEAYTDQQVRFVGEKTRGGRAVVQTVIVTDTTEIPVDYRLRLNNDRWYAYDVVIEGASLVNNYRSTFAAIHRSSGIQGILDDLQTRIGQYHSAGGLSRTGGASQ